MFKQAITTVVACSFLLVGCGSDTPKKSMPSINIPAINAPKVSLPVETKKIEPIYVPNLNTSQSIVKETPSIKAPSKKSSGFTKKKNKKHKK